MNTKMTYDRMAKRLELSEAERKDVSDHYTKLIQKWVDKIEADCLITPHPSELIIMDLCSDEWRYG
jgi:hypothetical protein